ncbi:hypothetical protein PVL29_025467 [Vitis rotundifolia]|uniref:Uncharacterized protein n=1 Tax=Vitis rotundifolia TaxID=103349 RepID=A0AA39D4K9_VITRO|nr:hypothetical protein PVL29_025467 [Vitis rotundifolia]
MGRTPCCDKNGLKKGPWTVEEDQKLLDYIQKHGHGRWRTLPKNAGLKRCGKSCRLRWTNYLRPDIKRGRFSFEEEEAIIQLHGILGNKWSAIAARLPGRTDNEIKNYWNTRIRKKLLRMGIDPVTHAPRIDLLELASLLGSSLYNSSSQLNVPAGSLGMGPMVNADVLTLATALLSSHYENPELQLQNLQENQLRNPQVQNQFESFQGNNLQSSIQEVQACPTSSATSTPFLNETQLMQAIAEHLFQNPTDFAYQNSLPNLWQVHGGHPSTAASFTNPTLSFDSIPSSITGHQTLKSNAVSNNTQNFSFDSVLSTPSYTSTPLNSSPMNYAKGSTEDERDSYCSDFLMFDIPSGLDVNAIM